MTFEGMNPAADFRQRWVHLVGIGGMHMSAIAQLLLAEGARVSGSDLLLTPLTDRLGAMGATVHAGHDAANLGAATLVVTTAAAKSDNVELIEAARRGVPVIPRHEMVARLMEGRQAIAIAGTHGKTTTSSMIAVTLKRAGFDPAYMLGGECLDLGGNAAAGSGRQIVVEADEYAGAFLAYHPEIAVVTNIETDHLDYFGSESCIRQAFGHFARNVPAGGLIVACADDPAAVEVLEQNREQVRAEVQWYGAAHQADWRISDITLRGGPLTKFSLDSRSGRHGPLAIRLVGQHNVSNAAAAFAVAHHLGLTDKAIADAFITFRGARRRFELAGEEGGVTVIDDYAHHPTEIEATLAAARARYPHRRLVVLFQPHTFSRTQYLLERFKQCFAQADALYLLQTFAARETPNAGLDAYALARALPQPPVAVLDSLVDAVAMLGRELRAGDVCLTMGAGDVTNAGRPLVEELRRR
ncbi:MAG TPA: UDP-N-acetylmuramate--L-alanine ligase [Dehalococcoidia bacterium]|nr:UDP-N-acetylmuramate--L-alanine ligase [Dehalococcoidia bacterium]